ncbi:MAG: hypothetical protein KDN19_19995 [Verrucomicrobiae bacterium]|nr:hypothetical protein [Verrucomicrobiae bacterium]
MSDRARRIAGTNAVLTSCFRSRQGETDTVSGSEDSTARGLAREAEVNAERFRRLIDESPTPEESKQPVRPVAREKNDSHKFDDSGEAIRRGATTQE